MREGAGMLEKERDETGVLLAKARKHADEASAEVARLTGVVEKVTEECSALKTENSSLKSELAKLKGKRASEAETVARKVKEATAAYQRDLAASVEECDRMKALYKCSLEGSNKQIQELQGHIQDRERLATEALVGKRQAVKEREEEARRFAVEKVHLERRVEALSQQLVEVGARKDAEEARAAMAERALEEDKHQAQEEAMSRFVQSSRMAAWVNWNLLFRMGTVMAQVRQVHPDFQLIRPLGGLIPSTPPPYTPPQLGFFVDDVDCPFDAWDATGVPEHVRMAPGRKFSDLGDPLREFKERCRRVLEERRAAAEAAARAGAGEVVQEKDGAEGAS